MNCNSMDIDHLPLLIGKDCWNLQCTVTGTSTTTHTSALLSIYIPPWAGGEYIREVCQTATSRASWSRAGHHSQPSASKCRDSTTDDNVCMMTQSRKEGTGTSTNCSASCGARSSARCGMVSSRVIVGTSITCSATTGSVTKNLTTSDNWSTICGTRTSIIGTGAKDSMIGSTVCRRTRACGPGGSPRLGGRLPPGSWRVVLVLVPLLPGPGGSLQSP